MSDKLDELVSSVQKHVTDKRAELTALQTQLKALQSAHADLHQEVDKAQTRLLEARNAIDESGKELRRRRAEATKIADGIITAAHAKRAQVEDDTRKLVEGATTKILDADKHLQDIEAMITAKEELFNSLVNDVNSECSKLAAVKAEARKIADG